MYHVYGKKWCVYCERAKALLEEKKLNYEFHNVEEDPEAMKYFTENGRGMKTVPAIFEDENLVGGFDNLRARLK